MPRIVAVGMSNTDLVCRTPRLPAAGETVAGSSFATFAGGKGANQAVAAARAGADVAFCGAVGDDQYGSDRRADLKNEGIDVDGLQTVPDTASGIALIVVDDAGENQIVTVAGANGQVDASDVVATMRAASYDVLMMTWELEPATCEQVLATAEPNVQIVVNTAPFHPSVATALSHPSAIVICNEVEAGQLLGRQVEPADALDAAIELQRRGCKAVVITIGADGACAVDSSQRISVRPPDVKVIDTTGAGDTFCGVFATWLAEGATLEQAVAAGVHAGALATTRHGAQPSIPRRAEIEASVAGQ